MRISGQVHNIGILSDAYGTSVIRVFYDMRTYYYFRDRQGWFKENYTQQGKLVWTHTNDIRKAYRVDSAWLIKHQVSKQLSGYYYWIEQRDHYQKLITERQVSDE